MNLAVTFHYLDKNRQAQEFIRFFRSEEEAVEILVKLKHKLPKIGGLFIDYTVESRDEFYKKEGSEYERPNRRKRLC